MFNSPDPLITLPYTVIPTAHDIDFMDIDHDYYRYDDDGDVRMMDYDDDDISRESESSEEN